MTHTQEGANAKKKFIDQLFKACKKETGFDKAGAGAVLLLIHHHHTKGR